MTRKDYQLIADIIISCHRRGVNQASIDLLVFAAIDRITQEHPSFDKQKFRLYIKRATGIDI